MTSPAPPPPGAPDAASNVNDPVGRVTGAVGMSLVTTLTRPPIALAPYSSVAGPRTTSMLDADAGFDVDAVVARLTGQVAHPQAVFDDQHAVAVETADDGTRRSRTEAAQRDAGLVLERRAERALQLLRQLLSAEHVGGLKRLELIPAFRRHRHYLTVSAAPA